MNSSNSLSRAKEAPSQAITGSVDDAIRLGCAAIGYTIYPGSDVAFDMMEDLRELTAEAKAKGLAVVVWSYPRGGALSKEGELAVDVGAYAAHMAALLGAHIIKVKLPTDYLEQAEAKKVYEKEGIDISTQAARVRHVMQAAFNGRRIVVFSGGAMKGADAVYQDAQDIYDGGGNGQIIGRNTFQRPRDQALEMLDKIINIFLGKVRHEPVAKGRRVTPQPTCRLYLITPPRLDAAAFSLLLAAALDAGDVACVQLRLKDAGDDDDPARRATCCGRSRSPARSPSSSTTGPTSPPPPAATACTWASRTRPTPRRGASSAPTRSSASPATTPATWR